MEMTDDKITIMQNNVNVTISQNNTGNTTKTKAEQEANNKEHGGNTNERGGINGIKPIKQLDTSGDGNNSGGGGKVRSSINIHTNHKHVMTSDNTTQNANNQQGNNHGISTKDRRHN